MEKAKAGCWPLQVSEVMAQAVTGTEKFIIASLEAESASQVRLALSMIANGSISGATYRPAAARLWKAKLS